ncbi:hypothetical protein Y695_02183 [Hydrogenophaga sp. T4]|nr:hypothetical protein Y695_02183 [Hydrogenophaga sp. T4]
MSLGKWRKNSVSSSTWMCEPSTSASLRMQTLPYRRPLMSGVSSGPCGSMPMATEMSWISLLANRRSRSTSQVLSTLPRSGRMAWLSLSRPILALPPAESPSTRNTSLCARSLLSQSVSLPGNTATPEPLRFSTFWPAFWRNCAALMASSASFLP